MRSMIGTAFYFTAVYSFGTGFVLGDWRGFAVGVLVCLAAIVIQPE